MSHSRTFAGNPFPGLRAFEPDEEHLFFGREPQVDELLAHLRRARFVAVVGASGSGKSSLVRAGLLPALHGGFMAAAGSSWYVAVMRPGHSPIASLASALDACGVVGGHGDPVLRVGLVRAVLERGALGLVEVVAQARLAETERLLVVVDQFEELLRFKAIDAVAFVKVLLAAVAQSRFPIYVVITMRSDFLGDVSQFRALPEAISDSLFLVPRLTRVQFQRAIEGPIRVAGGRIAPRLTNRLLNDLEDDADQLPVLQHALMRTWSAHVDRMGAEEPLDIPDLEAIGALSQALSLHGDEVFAALRSDRLREVAERVFKCLTDRGEDNRGVRRPTRFADVCAVVDAEPAEVREVVEAFRAPGCSFLMPPPPVHVDDDTVLDISHESLMRIWKRLQRWVEEEAESAQVYRRLAGAAQLHGEGKAALWRDPDLQIAVNWRHENHPTAAWGERIAPGFDGAMRFLDESLAARSRERRERTARVRILLVALAVIAVALTGLSIVAFSQWRIADSSLRVERAERLADLSSLQQGHGGKAARLAADAYAMVKTPRTEGAMLEELLRLRALRGVAVGPVEAEAFAKHGRLLVVARNADANGGAQLVVFDSLNLATIGRRPLDTMNVQNLCGSPDAAWFAATDGRSIELYIIGEKGAPLPNGTRRVGRVGSMACLPGRHAVVFAGAMGVRTMDFEAAGTEVARADAGAFERLESTAKPACVRARQCTPPTFSSDGKHVTWVAGDWIHTASVARLTDVISRPCQCANKGVRAYDPNTQTFVTNDGGTVVEHALEGTTAPGIGRQEAPAWPGSFATLGSRLIMAGTNGIHIYDLDRYRSQLATVDDVSETVRISDPGDGVHVAAYDDRDGTVRVVALAPGPSVANEFSTRLAPSSRDPASGDPAIAYDPADQSVTLADADGIVRYTSSGHLIDATSWSALATAAKLPTWYPQDPYSLSSRGSYVGLVPPQLNPVPGTVPPTVSLVSTKGGLVGRFASAPFVSIDEARAVGLLSSDDDSAFGVYRLPRANRLPGLELPPTKMAALSPNAETVAYAIGLENGAETGIQLFSVGSNSRIGPELPPPHDARTIENLAFSDDARYLIATYRIGASQRSLYVYSVDPSDWQRTLCLWVGLTSELGAPGGCAKFTSEIVR